MNSLPTLDQTDSAILAALAEDGRAGFGVIGESVGLSGDAVRERLRRLEGQGIVSVVGTPDPAALGFHAIAIAIAGVRVSGPLEPVAHEIAKMAEVDFLTCTLGDYDIILEVLGQDEEHLLRCTTNGSGRYPV